MLNLNRAKSDETLLAIVRVLSTEFPDCSITSDLDYYPLDDGCIIVNVIGVCEDDALLSIRKVIPTYSLDAADIDEFTVFICFNTVSPEKHNLKEVLFNE